VSELLEGYVPEDEYLRMRGIGQRQAQRERRARIGPPFVKLGRETYYSVAGFRAYLVSREIKPVKGRAA
jgi:hypothetical protein